MAVIQNLMLEGRLETQTHMASSSSTEKLKKERVETAGSKLKEDKNWHMEAEKLRERETQWSAVATPSPPLREKARRDPRSWGSGTFPLVGSTWANLGLKGGALVSNRPKCPSIGCLESNTNKSSTPKIDSTFLISSLV